MINRLTHNLNLSQQTVQQIILLSLSLLLLNTIMTTNSSTPFKLQRKLSVQGQLPEKKDLFALNKHHSMQPQFHTENSIEFKPFAKFHSGEHDLQNISRNRQLRRLVSISDEHQNMEYSSTDQVSRTLIGLGMRKGLSFQKEKIDFSLSDEAYDTDQQNLILRKKIAEMKKQVNFYRDHDEVMFQDVLKAKERAETAQKELAQVNLQLEMANTKIQDLENELNGQQRRIEELQRLLAHKTGSSGCPQVMNELQKELEHYQSLLRRQTDQIDSLKEQHQHQIFQNSLKFRKILEEAQQKFENAKSIGQNQINELVAKLMKKDEEIKRLKTNLDTPRTGLNHKASTLLSDHVQKSKEKDSPRLDTPSGYKYMNRFIQFSQFIDERIHKSLSKQKPQGRISKSAINKDQELVPKTKQLAIKMPESPPFSNKKADNFFKIGNLVNKSERMKTPTHLTPTHAF